MRVQGVPHFRPRKAWILWRLPVATVLDPVQLLVYGGDVVIDRLNVHPPFYPSRLLHRCRTALGERGI